MDCTRCGNRLVEVDNPMRTEVRHPRGVDCPGPLTATEEKSQEELLRDLAPHVVKRDPSAPLLPFARWAP